MHKGLLNKGLFLHNPFPGTAAAWGPCAVGPVCFAGWQRVALMLLPFILAFPNSFVCSLPSSDSQQTGHPRGQRFSHVQVYRL